LKVGEFPCEFRPPFAYLGYVRRRWALMCPGLKHLQVLTAPFGDDFDVSIGLIAHVSGKCKFFRLIIGRKSKPDALHSPTDD